MKGTKGIDFRYWIPLLALFTGARLSELAQLHKADIRKEQGIWCLNITENGGGNSENPKKSQDPPTQEPRPWLLAVASPSAALPRLARLFSFALFLRRRAPARVPFSVGKWRAGARTPRKKNTIPEKKILPTLHPFPSLRVRQT